MGLQVQSFVLIIGFRLLKYCTHWLTLQQWIWIVFSVWKPVRLWSGLYQHKAKVRIRMSPPFLVTCSCLHPKPTCHLTTCSLLYHTKCPSPWLPALPSRLQCSHCPLMLAMIQFPIFKHFPFVQISQFLIFSPILYPILLSHLLLISRLYLLTPFPNRSQTSLYLNPPSQCLNHTFPSCPFHSHRDHQVPENWKPKSRYQACFILLGVLHSHGSLCVLHLAFPQLCHMDTLSRHRHALTAAHLLLRESSPSPEARSYRIQWPKPSPVKLPKEWQ